MCILTSLDWGYYIGNAVQDPLIIYIYIVINKGEIQKLIDTLFDIKWVESNAYIHT